jgi:hypothetical protein
MEENKNLPQPLINFNQNLELYSKVVSSNINGFSVYSDEQLAIETFSFLYMLCKKTVPNPYGYWSFFLDDFSKTYKYYQNLTVTYDLELCERYLKDEQGINLKDIPYLLQKEKEKFKKEGLPSPDTNRSTFFVFQRFGNILYELKEIEFPFPQKTQTVIYNSGDASKFGKANTLIDDFIVYYNNRGNRIGIDFKPNFALLESNYTLFDIINLETLPQLRKGNLTKGYFFLSSGLNDILTNKVEDLKIKVNDGCSLFNINFAELRKNKYELKKKLELLNGHMPDYLKFNISEDKLTNTSKHNYLLVLSLKEKKQITKTDISNINKIRYESYYRKKLYDIYVNYHLNIQKDNKLEFLDWLGQVDIDLEYKKIAYIDSQAVVYKRKLLIDSPEVIYEFLPEITLNKKELFDKLKKDKSLSFFDKIDIKNYDEFLSRLEPLDKYYKNKTLHYSIDLFKKFNDEISMVLYKPKEDQFFVLKKKQTSLIPELIDNEA